MGCEDFGFPRNGASKAKACFEQLSFSDGYDSEAKLLTYGVQMDENALVLYGKNPFRKFCILDLGRQIAKTGNKFCFVWLYISLSYFFIYYTFMKIIKLKF